MSYVCGFMFSENLKWIALINKIKPEWQFGKLNGIGGKIKHDKLEWPINAMIREFFEETGVQTTKADWRMFCLYELKSNSDVYFFVGSSDKVHYVKTKEEEIVLLKEFALLKATHFGSCMPNLAWLIPMALDLNVKTSKVQE